MNDKPTKSGTVRGDKPTEAQVLAAIEVIKAHLDADWISCCEKDHAFGCASCQAVDLKRELDSLAGWLEVLGDDQ